jgi:hypothetical protein
VASTDHCSVSVRWMCLTRASPLRADRAQLVQHQLQPQLRGLVLEDEQQLVVVLGHADRVLRVEDLVEVQILPVREIDLEVPDDAVLEGPAVAIHPCRKTHLIRCWRVSHR